MFRRLGLGCLVVVVGTVGSIILISVVASTSPDTPRSTPRSRPPARTVQSTPKAPAPTELLLLSWSWHQERDYAIVEGEVENISGHRLVNVEALVTFKTKDGEFITSDSSLIEYQILMPDQKSPFKVMARWNPLMSNAHISFKTLFGDRIRWEKADE